MASYTLNHNFKALSSSLDGSRSRSNDSCGDSKEKVDESIFFSENKINSQFTTSRLDNHHDTISKFTMASSSTARASLYRQYSRGSSGGGSSSSIENLPPRTIARVAREVRDLVKNAPEGVRLVVDNETGMPSNLGEVVVRALFLCNVSDALSFGFVGFFCTRYLSPMSS